MCRESSRYLGVLEQAYGPWLKVTLAEPSSSIVVRSEHQFNREERKRLGLRKHLYELSTLHGEEKRREHNDRNPVLFDDALLRVLTESLDEITTNAADRSEAGSALDGLKDSSFVSLHEFQAGLMRVLPDARWHSIRERLAAVAFSPLDCYMLDSKDRFGHYVGFLDLRPSSEASPIAMGVLGLPRRYRHNGDVRIITGVYGPLYGGPSFDGTIYSMHDQATSGAACAQACMIMALGFLSDRGARVSGNYTLTYLGRSTSPVKERRFRIPVEDQATASEGERHLGNLPHGAGARRCVDAPEPIGLPMNEIVSVLNARDVSAYRYKKREMPDDANDFSKERLNKMMARLIEANILARFPMILAVDMNHWWPWLSSTSPAASETVEPPPAAGRLVAGNGHAVTIVGYRRVAKRPDHPSLIVHDPGYAPFYERSFDRCVKARFDDQWDIAFVAPRSIRLQGVECIEWLLKYEQPSFAKYFRGEDECDYQIALVGRDELADRIYARPVYPSTDREYVAALQDKLERKLARAPYWCIAGTRQRSVEVVWFFDARRKSPFKYRSESLTYDALLQFGPKEGARRTTQVMKRAAESMRSAAAGDSESPRIELPKSPTAIRSSVITSASSRDLDQFIQDVRKLCGDDVVFDAFLLRDSDLKCIGDYGAANLPQRSLRLSSGKKIDEARITEIMSDEENSKLAADWLSRVFREQGAKVAALATYFPNITSAYPKEREEASNAICNSLRVALRLAREGLTTNGKAIIEIVAGTILDPCTCEVCDRGKIFAYARTRKIRWLVEGVERAIRLLPKEDLQSIPLGIGVEIEPGDTYVMNNYKAVKRLVKAIDARPGDLGNVLGINLDIAHARIIGLHAHQLLPYRDRIVHAHISDHPGMHTRDQIVGKWTSVFRPEGGYSDYLRLLHARASHGRGRPPFSGAISLELEGCNRLAWIGHSLFSMRQAMSLVR